MLEIKRITKSLEEVLEGPPQPAEERIFCDTVWPAVLVFQQHPDIALDLLTGIAVPPHQRTMARLDVVGARTNTYICSRGTAKTTTIAGFSATHSAWFNANRDGVLLHAGGFRGGQMLFNDIERWIEGGFDSQTQGLTFLGDSINRSGQSKNPVTRQASYWQIQFKSHSNYTVLPTGDPERILGMRAKTLRIDEANVADSVLIEKIAVPFLNVKGDFRHGGAYAASNSVHFTTTVDYTFRPFMRNVRAATAAIERDFEAWKALLARDMGKYREFARQGLGRHVYVQLDYTDILIRAELTDHDGNRFRVHWPNPDIPITTLQNGIPFTERKPDGTMARDCPAVDVYPTYPIDFEMIEGPLRDGAADEATWKAEQRNIIDSAAGDVYPNAVVDECFQVGERYVLPFKRMPESWKQRYPDERDFTLPVMWRCDDPCVIGVDYAGGDRDFCAYTVIRIGPMATAEFNPLLTPGPDGQVYMGRTPWSNVIWCEQHHYSSHDDVREKLWQLMSRYNVVYFQERYEDDPWKACRGIGLDMRGGGQGVRDSLVYINSDEVPQGRVRIIDPFDKDERVVGYLTDPNTKPMLDCIWPQDTTNEKLVEFTKGQMQMGLLYFPKYLVPSDRGPQRELDPAYEACKLLEHQLRKIQQELTARARKFVMPGNKENVEGKKDLFSSFLYAGKQLRAHLIRHQLIQDTPPPTGGRVTRIGAKRRGMGLLGRAPGSKA